MQMLDFITEEKNLKVVIDHKLNFPSRIVTQVKKANEMMSLNSFSSLVRLYLECCL